MSDDIRLFKLGHAYLDEQISLDELKELEALLRGSSNAQRKFAMIVWMHGQLLSEYRAKDMLDYMESLERGDTNDETGHYEVLSDLLGIEKTAKTSITTLKPSSSTTHGQEQPAAEHVSPLAFEPATPTNVRRVIVIPRWLVWGSVAAVIALLISVTGLYLWPSTAPRDATTVVEAPPPDETAAEVPEVAALQPVATVTDQLDAQWDAEAALSAGQRLKPGDAFTLKSGYAEITCDRGAVVTLEAPSHIRIIDDNTIALTSGRLVAHCPKSARRFTVRTPHSQIVDFGTEFGVEVGEDNSTQAVVYTGLVELSEVAADPAQPARAVRLTAGWSSTVDASGRLAAAATRLEPTDELRFARSLRQAKNPVFQYQRQVLAAGPIGYWRFENLASPWQTNHARPGVYDLAVVGDVREAKGVFGVAAKFQAQQGVANLFRSHEVLAELAGAAAFTVELWCQPAVAQDGTLVDLFLERSGEYGVPHALVTELRNTSDASYNPPSPSSGPYVRALHRDPPSALPETGLNVYGRGGYEPGRWLHLVVVKRVDRLELFLNGELVEAIDDKAILSVAPYLMVGCSGNIWTESNGAVLDPKAKFPYRELTGLVDELAVYAHSLDAEEIKLHYLAGQAQLVP